MGYGGSAQFQSLVEDMPQQSIGNARVGDLRRLGEFVRDRFIPKRLQQQFMDAQGELLLILDHALMALPWELVNLGGEFLSLRLAMSRQIVADGASARFTERPPGRVKRVLIVSNPTGDVPEAQQEAEALYEEMQQWSQELAVSFLAQTRASRYELLSRLPQQDIVYYVGHTTFDQHQPAHSGWELSGERLTIADLDRVSRLPALLFVNGCRSACTGGALGIDGAYGMPEALLRAGASHYLGAVWEIPLSTSISFAAEFFRSLLCGNSIGASVRDARRILAEHPTKSSSAWASYTLYGNPATSLPTIESSAI
jgi:CHAT domain-containing protein